MNEENAESRKNDNNDEKDIKVYVYLKEHPSILVACVSAIVAVATFIMNAVIFFLDYRYFQFWGFDIARSEYNNPNQIYMIAITVVYLISITLIQRYCTEVFNEYFNRTAFLPVAKQIVKKYQIQCKKERKSKKSRAKENELSMSQDYCHAEDSEQESDDRAVDTHKLKRELRHANWIMLKRSVTVLFPSAIIMLLVMMLYFAASGVVKLTFLKSIFLSLLMSVCTILVDFIFLFSFERSALKHEIRKIRDNKKALFELFDKKVQLAKTDYPVFKWKDLRLKDAIRDSKLKTNTISYLIPFIIYFILMSFLTNSIQNRKKEFPICYIDEKPYTIVYQSLGTYYLDRAEIEDYHISIDTRSHRIVSSNDVAYKNEVFQDVIILRD